MTIPHAQGLRWVLWAGTVGFTSTLAERFAAAADAGYEAVTLSPPDVLAAAERGTSAADIGRHARDLGLALIVDPVMNWYPDSTPSPSRFAGVAAADALRMCEALGARSCSAIGTGASDVPLADLPEFFGRLCDDASNAGVQVHLEFIPFTVVRDVRTAWDIVRIADRPGSGLVFDTWHFFRGDADYQTLATIPGERVLQVQIDDAAAEPDGPLREETQRRLLPGEGAFDLRRVVRALDDIGALNWIGPEVINPMLTEMPVLDAARLALDRSRAAVTAALSV